MAAGTGAIGGVMQAAIQQMRPQMNNGGESQVPPAMPGQGAQTPATSAQQGAEGVGFSNSNMLRPPAITPWAKLTLDPQQELAQLRQQLEQWVQSVMTNSAREFNFSKDNATGELITRVVNPKTGEMVRQVPSDISLHVQYWLQQVYGHDPTKPRGWSFSALA